MTEFSVESIDLNRIDWVALAELYRQNGWVFGFGYGNHFPSAFELKNLALGLQRNCLEDKSDYHACGRLVYRRGEGLFLELAESELKGDDV